MDNRQLPQSIWAKSNFRKWQVAKPHQLPLRVQLALVRRRKRTGRIGGNREATNLSKFSHSTVCSITCNQLESNFYLLFALDYFPFTVYDIMVSKCLNSFASNTQRYLLKVKLPTINRKLQPRIVITWQFSSNVSSKIILVKQEIMYYSGFVICCIPLWSVVFGFLISFDVMTFNRWNSCLLLLLLFRILDRKLLDFFKFLSHE